MKIELRAKQFERSMYLLLLDVFYRTFATVWYDWRLLSTIDRLESMDSIGDIGSVGSIHWSRLVGVLFFDGYKLSCIRVECSHANWKLTPKETVVVLISSLIQLLLNQKAEYQRLCGSNARPWMAYQTQANKRLAIISRTHWHSPPLTASSSLSCLWWLWSLWWLWFTTLFDTRTNL